MRRTVLAPVATVVLAAASLACFALPSVHSFPIFPAKSADTPAQASAPARQQQADLPITVYDPQISDDTAAGLPEVIMAGQRTPNRAGQPETIYGDANGQHVTEISAAPVMGALPNTVYAGEEASAVAAAGLPETITAGTRTAHMAGQPETVYGSAEEPAEQALVENEAVAAAEQATQAPPTTHKAHHHAQIAANPNGFGVETQPGHYPPPQVTASPYTHLTDAQRVGQNPCEIKNHQASPYTNLTDAQRAGQTNCF
jgi:hypothetical protein